MTRQPSHNTVPPPQARLHKSTADDWGLRLCGAVGLIGCIAVLTADLIAMIVVEGYNPISQTISSLGIGERAWIQDLGLNLYGLGLVVSAIGLLYWNLGDWRWKLGNVLYLLLGLNMFIIAEHDQYQSLPDPSGIPIHLYGVYTLGVVFCAVCFLLSFGLRRVSRGWRRFSRIIAVVWAVLAPPFFLVPESVNGLYERFIALILLAWTGAIAALLFRQGNR